MENQSNSPLKSSGGDKGKTSTRITQIKTIFDFLQHEVATASMVTAATGVPQKCITRYKRDLEKSGRLWEVKRTYCKETGFMAWYLTTDPGKAPNRQLNIFD